MNEYELESRANWKSFLKKVFLKISQNSQENNCVGVSYF